MGSVPRYFRVRNHYYATLHIIEYAVKFMRCTFIVCRDYSRPDTGNEYKQNYLDSLHRLHRAHDIRSERWSSSRERKRCEENKNKNENRKMKLHKFSVPHETRERGRKYFRFMQNAATTISSNVVKWRLSASRFETTRTTNVDYVGKQHAMPCGCVFCIVIFFHAQLFSVRCISTPSPVYRGETGKSLCCMIPVRCTERFRFSASFTDLISRSFPFSTFN